MIFSRLRSEILRSFPEFTADGERLAKEKHASAVVDNEQHVCATYSIYPSRESIKGALSIPPGSLLSEHGQRCLHEYLEKSMPEDKLVDIPPSMDLMESGSEIKHGSSSSFYRISDAVSLDRALVIKKSAVSGSLKNQNSSNLSGNDVRILGTYLC